MEFGGESSSDQMEVDDDTRSTYLLTTAEFSRGKKVFARSGSRPHWPGRILTADH